MRVDQKVYSALPIINPPKIKKILDGMFILFKFIILHSQEFALLKILSTPNEKRNSNTYLKRFSVNRPLYIFS